MKILFAILIVIVLFLGGVGAGLYHYLSPEEALPRVPSPTSIRELSSGEIIGFQGKNEVHAWIGIPYAAPPVGKLRWRAPRAAEAWEGRQEMTAFGSRCLQMNIREPDLTTPVGSEDCLYLNVWAPPYAKEAVPTGDQALPVMFWIHGGGNTIGEAATSIYDGSLLASDHKVIVVSVNYRLGPMGWFLHPALTGDSPLDASGNYGTLDIIHGLEWVQDNIAVFGGDPGNVTVFGESAGGMNVLSLLGSSLTDGLFHRAISQSGIVISVTREEAMNPHAEGGHEFSSHEITNRLLLAAGKAPDISAATRKQAAMAPGELADWLRDQSGDDIFAVFDKTFGGMIDSPAVIADGVVLPQDYSIEQLAQRSGDTPVMLGTNRDETRLFTMFSDATEKTFGLPSSIKDPEAYNRDNRYASNVWKAQGVDAIATALVASGNDQVYAYRFDADDWRNYGSVDLKELMGAAHAMELFFVFGNFPRPARVIFPDSTFEAMQLLSNSMMSYWAEFAYKGNPGTGRFKEETRWLSWSNGPDSEPRLLVLDTEIDEGIRMSNERITVEEIRKAFYADSSYDTVDARCAGYRMVFGFGVMASEEEYASLGDCSEPLNAR